MVTYLTKIEDGKTHHFRASVENAGVSIVRGIFYNWLSKHWEGCGNKTLAVARQKQLVDDKQKEGFRITEFRETLENTIDVYDKAKWHFGGEFPAELDSFQGYVHNGMFLGWLIDSDLVSDDFKNDNDEAIEAFKQKELTGSQIFEQYCDGVLMLHDITELGNRFTLHYFKFGKGQYLVDYGIALSGDLPSMYHVADTWENYEILKAILDKRFSIWKDQNIK